MHREVAAGRADGAPGVGRLERWEARTTGRLQGTAAPGGRRREAGEREAAAPGGHSAQSREAPEPRAGAPGAGASGAGASGAGSWGVGSWGVGLQRRDPDCREAQHPGAGTPNGGSTQSQPAERPQRREAATPRSQSAERRQRPEPEGLAHRKAAAPVAPEACNARSPQRPEVSAPQRREGGASETETPESRPGQRAGAGVPAESAREAGVPAGPARRSRRAGRASAPKPARRSRGARPGGRLNAGFRHLAAGVQCAAGPSESARAQRAGSGPCSGVVVAVGFQVAAEAVEGSAAGRADAADRDAQLGGYFGVRRGWVLHQEFHQAPLGGR